MNHVTTVSLPAVAIARLVAAVQSLTLEGPRFVGVTYRAKESNELARHVLIVGASYSKLLQGSLDILSLRKDIVTDAGVTQQLSEAMKAHAKGSLARKAAKASLDSYQHMIGAERAAAAELFVAYGKTLAAHAEGQECNADYTKAGLCERICVGVKVSRADGTFELSGLSHSKQVIEAGTYAHVASSEKTLAKRVIKRALPAGKYRTLALDAGVLHSVRIGGTEVDVT